MENTGLRLSSMESLEYAANCQIQPQMQVFVSGLQHLELPEPIWLLPFNKKTVLPLLVAHQKIHPKETGYPEPK